MPRTSHNPVGDERNRELTFGVVLERYRPALFSIALDRTGRVDAAEELAQQALVQAWVHRRDLRDLDKLGPWLFRIAINCSIDWLRRRSSSPRRLEEIAERSLDPSPVIEHVISRETIREVRKALAHLPLGNRVALLMHVAGYSYGEIAAFLGQTEAVVRGRIARARNQLRRALLARLRQHFGPTEGETP